MIAATIIIPTYNHAQFLPSAVGCALAQTVPCEVIVVDDGSTDDTQQVLQQFARHGDRFRVLYIDHAGPSAARNVGLDAARGEFIMFLDADDVIARNKLELQLAEVTPEIGWVLCDVRIEDEATGTTKTASQAYDYASKQLSGWIQPLLTAANFIPIMSPLVRKSVLEGIRFQDELVPEDWHFWHSVAGVARVRYVPKVLATYQHRRQGRSRIPKKARTVVPNVEQPLRLNLGCGTPNTRSWHPIKGLVNLDKSLGWTFEDGLGDFIAGSVAGITVSHSLMYVAIERWPYVFAEFARVLEPGGVLRITEDDALDPASSRFGGWKGSDPARTLIDANLVAQHMERAGFKVYAVDATTTRYRDGSLMQAQHGVVPDVFFIEGVRQSCVLFSPHNDDETLFASALIMRYRPRVFVCYASVPGYGDAAMREAETREAAEILGASGVEQWPGGDIEAQMREVDARMHPTVVFAPSSQASHPEHVTVANAARDVFGDRVVAYHTYDENGKVVGVPVPFEPEYVERKLRALCRYPSQIKHARAYIFFMADLNEYTE